MKKSINKSVFCLFVVMLLLSMTGCGSLPSPFDFLNTEKINYADAESFEYALNNGENLEGKIVQFQVNDLIPDSAFGYNLWAGKHLNFVSNNHPNAGAGDMLVVKATQIQSTLGSWIINYEVVDHAKTDKNTITKASLPETTPADTSDEEDLMLEETSTEAEEDPYAWTPVDMSYILNVTDSSHFSGKKNYPGSNIVDGDLATSWQEGVEGWGEEESVTIELDAICKISGFSINAGNQKTKDLYYENGRPETITLIFSDGIKTSEQCFDLADGFTTQTFSLEAPVNADSITIRIDSVYYGGKYTDTCISEVTLF